ncbi:MFS general substrate transporter [Patellaria atrata CBS 101060]|uniref:MFS general substrate transporter n=1 Tax=Patellaria atrata CBS 101060 TaxID=1346257 RepID=A0A9P4SBM3_9PEZI|nr:MFS general substrate transporter [Patellaria atrata CBS 101060]
MASLFRPPPSTLSSPSHSTPSDSPTFARLTPSSSSPSVANDSDVDDGTDEEEQFVRNGKRRASTQSFELYTPDEERVVRKKLDRKLVAFLAGLYLLSFLDRSNIGNARIAGLERDLGLHGGQYEWLLTAFYITYILFEWMTLLYRIIPPHIYISLCILSWGILASLQSVCTSFGSLLILRAFLGIGEAAFGPGVPFYLSFFFRRNELALRTGLFISAAPLATSFASGLAYAIVKLGEGGPIAPWRLLFLVEGFPSVLVAVFAWSFIPDSPGTAKFLSKRERKVAALRLRNETVQDKKEQPVIDEKGDRGNKNRRLDFSEILQTLADPKCYVTAMMFFSCNVAFSSLPVFLPTIIKDMGYTAVTSQALSAPPYLFSFLVVLFTAYASDRMQNRSFFIIIHVLLAASGYATMALAGKFAWSNIWRYLAVYPAAAGFFSAITIIITWTLNNQDSDSKKGTGIAMMNVIGQCGPLLGTRLYPKEDKPYYIKGMAICSAFMLFVAFLAVMLRLKLRWENEANVNRFENGEIEMTEVDEPLMDGRDTVRRQKPFVYLL